MVPTRQSRTPNILTRFTGVYAVYLIATNAVSSNVSTQMNLIQVKTSNSPGSCLHDQ